MQLFRQKFKVYIKSGVQISSMVTTILIPYTNALASEFKFLNSLTNCKILISLTLCVVKTHFKTLFYFAVAPFNYTYRRRPLHTREDDTTLFDRLRLY